MFDVQHWREHWRGSDSRALETMIAISFTGYFSTNCIGALKFDPACGVLRCSHCGEVIAQGNFNKPHIEKPPAYLTDFRAILELVYLIRQRDKTFQFAVEYCDNATVRLYAARYHGAQAVHVVRHLSDKEIGQSSGLALCQMALQTVLELYETIPAEMVAA